MAEVTAVFTKSSKLMGKIIAWGLGEPVSHCGIILHMQPLNLAVHSDVKGVDIVPVREFYHKRELVFEVATELTIAQVLNKIEVYSIRPYDHLGFIYWTLRQIGTKLFGLPPMERNPWASPKAYLCSELLADLLGEDTVQRSWSPYDVYLLLVERQK